MPLAAWRENSSRHVASLRRIRLLFFIAPVSSTITGRDYPQWTDLRKYVAELPVTRGRPSGLEEAQRRELMQALKAGALADGFPTDLWTLPRVGQLIERRFGRAYSESQVW